MGMLKSIIGWNLRYRSLGEQALARVKDADLHTTAGPDGNSLDVLVRHVGGNLRSRFTDFLTTDGEKPWRGRDGEFEERQATREEMLAIWTAGWDTLFATLDSLGPEDLEREITIRGRTLTVTEALHRSLAHTAYHVGQIVQLARMHVGEEWESLSVPRGASAAYAQDPDMERPPEV
jgi:hypothetical protein